MPDYYWYHHHHPSPLPPPPINTTSHPTRNKSLSTREDPKNPEIIYKVLCIYFYMFKLQLPAKYFPFDAIHLWRRFFHYSKQFLNLSILMPFSASAGFCLTSSTSEKRFPLRTFFIRETKKKVTLGEIGWMGRVGHRGHAFFGEKLLNTQRDAGRCAHKQPVMQWAKALIECSQRIHWSWTPQSQRVRWHRWVPRTLT